MPRKSANRGKKGPVGRSRRARAPAAPRRGRPKRAPRRKQKNDGWTMADTGAAVGGAMFGQVGAAVGRAAGALVPRIFGSGSYAVHGNSILSNGIPSFLNGGDGVRVCHREYLADVAGAVSFNLQFAYDINPGLSLTFPWLATIAQGFEEYEFRGLVFEFRTTCGSAVSSTNNAMGTVVFATNYDVLDPEFQTKAQMESYEYSTSVVPWQSMIHPVECKPVRNPLRTLYVRTGSIPVGADQRLYDLGLFQVGVSGQQATNLIGEIWVSYDVVFRKPRIPIEVGIGADPTILHAVEKANGTATAAAPFGTTGLDIVTNGIPWVYVSSAAPTTSIVFQEPGDYLIVMAWYGANIAGGCALSAGSNIGGLAILEDGTASSLTSYTSTACNYVQAIAVSAPGSLAANTCVFTGPTSMTAASVDVFISSYPYGGI